MRILYVLTSLGVGGAEKQVLDLAARMAAKGHSVALIALKHSEEEWPTKLPVLRLNTSKTFLGILRSLRFAAKFVALFRPDILHSHTFPANIFARLLRPMLRVRGVGPRVINTIHNVFEGGWSRMTIYRLTGPFAHQVTAVSAAAAIRFVQLHAVSAKKISVVTNGIDTDAFTPDRNRRKRMRASMRAGDRFIWLAIGRLVPAKDYPNLLQAFAQLQAANASLWIAGEGDPLAMQQGNLSNVHFLGLRRDIADLLDAADAYVLPSQWEGMPLAVAEAMAMGKPVVATGVGGVSELIADTGSVVPAQDSHALYTAMLEVMGLKENQRREMGRIARERIEAHFSMDSKAEEWERIYTKIMKAKGA